ncbi:hypothetical protein LOD99_16302 [Oopsacas minuta]|uniref:Uncharacterized protein n=1 Tax=Oopsacas minuta TaxID=111878 RepID=A0AAV7K7J9_9METZ|nr:hypothetical protein LOD99_16302 [Oopsacas minuta]
MNAKTLVYIVSLIIGFTCCKGNIDCIDENGRAVDWWTIAKIPEIKDSSNKWIVEGTGYLYFDSHQGSKLYFPDKSINSLNSAPGYTLSQLYKSSGSVGYAMYNDETPDATKDSTDAHSKGVVAYDSNSGFWLVHSVPSFPPYAGKSYSYPESGEIYGQSMLCMSLSLSNINTVGRQFQTNGPNFYNFSMPSSLISSLPDLYQATVNKKRVSVPSYNIATLTSMGGMRFTSFAKAKEFNKDLYSMLVAPKLQKSLLVETWIRGDKACDCSVCEPHNMCNYVVDDVNYVNFTEEVQYVETKDHSKWAVSKDKTTICIGDINRMNSQFHRGGGTVCFVETQLATIYEAAAQHNTCHECPGDIDIDIEVNINMNLKPKILF